MSASIKIIIVSVAIFWTGICDARAESYRVEYVVKEPAGETAGAVTCSYGQRCIVDLTTLQMRLAISTSGHNQDRAQLVLDGKNSCCLFEGATRRPSLDLRRHNWHLRLFVGEEARGLEYIENEPIGVLNLKFDLGNSDDPEAWPLHRNPI
jgi:hypothetical protein